MITTRKTHPKDLDLICRHRVAMFSDGGRRTESELASMDCSFRQWLKPRLGDRSYFGFIAENETNLIASVGLMELDWPPHPLHPEDGRRGYILNLYVESPYRKQGIARMLMDMAEQEFGRRGIRYAILHTTSAGRALYEVAGWKATSELAKVIS